MNELVTTEYWVIIALETCGHVPISIKGENFEGRKNCQLTYTFEEDALEDYEKWMRGVNDEPLGTVRKVQQSIERFKYNLSRYRQP